MEGNSILGIELRPVGGQTHYQVASLGYHVYQLDTKYQVGLH